MYSASPASSFVSMATRLPNVRPATRNLLLPRNMRSSTSTSSTCQPREALPPTALGVRYTSASQKGRRVTSSNIDRHCASLSAAAVTAPPPVMYCSPEVPARDATRAAIGPWLRASAVARDAFRSPHAWLASSAHASLQQIHARPSLPVEKKLSASLSPQNAFTCEHCVSRTASTVSASSAKLNANKLAPLSNQG